MSFEEVEALRLSDFEAMDQDTAAEKMNVSRGTFQRIVNAAGYKIADALINGKAIRIEGGDYEFMYENCGCMGHRMRFKGQLDAVKEDLKILIEKIKFYFKLQ